MKVVRAPEKSEEIADIFLAGSISTCRNQNMSKVLSQQNYSWREYIIENLSDTKGLIFNPERVHFPKTGSDEYFRQIDWERRCLINSRLIVFWLSGQKTQSYNSRFEIGFITGLNIPSVIGIEKGFKGGEYLETFLKTKPARTIEELILQTRNMMLNIKEG